MMYWDTSCVLKLYVAEPDSEYWMDIAQRQKTPLLSSDLLQTELACALRAKEHRNEIKSGGANALHARFTHDLKTGRFRCSPLGKAITQKASELVMSEKIAVSLRSLDALHLATCLHLECTLVATTDQRLASAAEAFEVTCKRPS